MIWRKRALGLIIVVLSMALFGSSERPISEVVRGSSELSQTRGRVTAREALALTKRLPSGEVVWATESYGQEFTTPFR